MNLPWGGLRSLRDLARHGTIAAVAEAQGYTAGAVSQQLAVLERAAGRPLLERVGRRVHLTDAGRVLVEHANRILDAEEDARAAQGLGITITTPMMLTLLPAPGLMRHELADDVRRDLVVIHRRGAHQRP